MDPVVEIVRGATPQLNKMIFSSFYNDPGSRKMVIVQDDDKFPSPRLCLLRRWPNFEGGFGFEVGPWKAFDDDVATALKVEEVKRNSPAEAGGLRRNDIIIEINSDNIEFKSFVPLVELLKEACSQNEMELLVLAEQDAKWYKVHNISVNSRFPNIEYCETPYLAHKLRPLEPNASQVIAGPKANGGTQIEFHSSSGKLYRTTLVIDKDNGFIYRRIEELPSGATGNELLASETSLPVYYRRDRTDLNTGRLSGTTELDAQTTLNVDSGHGTITNRRDTPLSQTANLTSPYSTLGKSYGTEQGVDLLHDKWADLMDQYLDNKFKSNGGVDQSTDQGGERTLKRNRIILNDPNLSSTVRSNKSTSRSRAQSPNDPNAFSFLKSGLDDYQTASATSFRELNSRSPYHRGSPHTQSYNRYTSPPPTSSSILIQSVQSPTKIVPGGQARPSSRPSSSTPQTVQVGQSIQLQQQQQDTSISSFSQSSYQPTHQQQIYYDYGTQQQQQQQPVRDTSTNRYPQTTTIHTTTTSTSPTKLQSGNVSYSLGFRLDEQALANKNVYIVKYVEPGTPSAMAGLKEGDKITKINGRTTQSMPYDEFCREIIIAQQQQMRNNMIHLMVMRKSAKATGTGTYSATTTSTSSMLSPPVLSTSKYHATNTTTEKSSSFDEGYVPGSATSSTATNIGYGTSSSGNNLISVVKVNQYDNTQQPQRAAYRPGEQPSYSSSYESYVKQSNVIYDSQNRQTIEKEEVSLKTEKITNDYISAPTTTTTVPTSPSIPLNTTTTTTTTNKPSTAKQTAYKLNTYELKPQYSPSKPIISVQKNRDDIVREQREREQQDKDEKERLERERQRAIEQERELQRAIEQERERAAAAERERVERERQRAAEEEARERAEALKKRERELEEARAKEKREAEAREQRERELREAWEREQREREAREAREREEREREAREREQRERERVERELREAREREERERAERERLERERAELERQERERAIERERAAERERAERERAERERFERERAERERQERERAERERQERERLERELAAERERQERERAERERFERERAEREERERIERERRLAENVVVPQPSAVSTALAALTTIVVAGERAESQVQQQQPPPPPPTTQPPSDKFEIPIDKSTDQVYSRYPIQQQVIDDTTTKIQEIYEVHQYKREEITRYSPTQATAQDATDFLNTSGSYTEPTTQYHELESEHDRSRREYAENEFIRQQEVMSYLIDAMDNPKLEEKLRTYSLYKSQHYFGYGIAFHTESIPATLPSHKLVYPLVEIEQNSPADEAGMRNGQRVVAVNGAFVNKEFKTLEDVVQAIEDSYYTRNFTEITVIDPDLWHECMVNPSYAAELARVAPTKDTRPQVYVTETYDKSVPRLCRLSRQYRSDPYGFDFKTLKSEGRHVANNVRPGLPADRAGLRDGDFILEVNGESLDKMEHDAVVNKITQKDPLQVDLLVVGDYQSYLDKKKISTTPVNKEPSYEGDEVNMDLRLPAKDIVYHRVTLIPTFKGLGISLTPNGIISAIEPNSPSDRAGLKKDDRIVEVNGIDVRERSNKEIARIIKEHENDLVIGVLDLNLDRDSYRPSDVKLSGASSTGNLTRIMDEVIRQPVSPTYRVAPQPSTTPTPSPSPAVKSDGTTHLKSIVSEMIKPSGSPVPLPTSETPNIKAIVTEAHSVEAPRPTYVVPSSSAGSIPGSRVCNLVSSPDYDGFGFSMRSNAKGPHQISSVEAKSPAEYAGLRVEDLILKVNDIPVVGERYSKTVTLIKNESERGRLRLEVIDPSQCPQPVRETELVPPASEYSTMTSMGKVKKAESIQNLSKIAREAGAGTSDRAQSVDAARTRPLSMSDMPQYPTGRDTVTSFGSVLLNEPQNQTGLMSQSTGTLSKADKSRFKRCNIHLQPEVPNQNFGFTLNSKIKPKYMIFSVDQDSPAYNANLRTNDVIVAVDSTNIRRLKFDKVKSMLSDAKKRGQVEILAISKEGYLYYKNKKKRFSSTKLVTTDNTDLYAYPTPGYSLSGTIRTRDISSDNEGDRGYSPYNRSQTPNDMQTSTYERAPSSNERLTSASTTRIDTTGRVEITTTTAIPTQSPRSPSAPATAATTSLPADDFEIIECVIQRGSPQQPLGLSLANQTANLGSNSLSRTSAVSFRDEQLPGPLITKVDSNSLAEQSGLRGGDTVLEINGTKTNGLNNKSIANLITSAGNEITFLVARKRLSPPSPPQIGFADDAAIRESALRITQDTIAEAKSRVQQQQQADEYQSGSQSGSPAIGQRHVSRRDSQNQSPRLIREEIKLSSSKLYGAYPDTHSTSSVSPSPPLTSNTYQQQQPQTPSPSASRYRNQSEPAPLTTNTTMPSASSTTDINNRSSYNAYTTDQQQYHQSSTMVTSSQPVQQPSPISRRSSSSYTLPSDAPIPRLCRVRAYEQQLGFTIAGSKANKGVFKISDVSPNSPAAHAGLQNDDYIIEISGQNVQNMQYSEVVDFIKAKKQEDDLQLLVADKQTLDWYKNKKLPIASQIVPKMQYIETLLKEELERDATAAAASDEVNRSLSDNYAHQ